MRTTFDVASLVFDDHAKILLIAPLGLAGASRRNYLPVASDNLTVKARKGACQTGSTSPLSPLFATTCTIRTAIPCRRRSLNFTANNADLVVDFSHDATTVHEKERYFPSLSSSFMPRVLTILRAWFYVRVRRITETYQRKKLGH